MTVKRFEDLICWQKAQDLAVEIYVLYRENRDYGFRDQICRAAVSISNNIAEGFDRRTNPDTIKFLDYARTSCHEVKSMTYLAVRIGYISQQKRDEHLLQIEAISKLIFGLIKSYERQTTPHTPLKP